MPKQARADRCPSATFNHPPATPELSVRSCEEHVAQCMSKSIQSILSHGTSGTIVDIQCGLSNNLPNIVIVGFANKAVDEAKERIRGAFSDSGLNLPRKRITINLAPADLPKADSGFDLAMAVSILAASEQIRPVEEASAFIGELGLDGRVRAVPPLQPWTPRTALTPMNPLNYPQDTG
jgi:hypothetical protein